ncbi:hypothetical protein PITCH_A1210001 [uncultured Desulfobacterium sp.]|uniref:Lcl C-terminal domain-containing protein n=1 Tax=uncultured Desulfobacterium sp. TaxID=201089 RepID=A0A445MRZ3_9BACT|nr:hypothetical protein PITCH_A1210001 [uncultured Desulfobacterium sp.]
MERYWSATTYSEDTTKAWGIYMVDGQVTKYDKINELDTRTKYAWPVRNADGSASNLWRTGQTRCYNQDGDEIDCAGTGQDGEIQAGIQWPEPRFYDNGDGTVTDYLTGLMWFKDTGLLGNMPWLDALDAIDDLNISPEDYNDTGYTAAYNDWRLPNRKELLSLIDYSQSNPALPQIHPFNIRVECYWSSTTDANLPNTAWQVYVLDGYLSNSTKTYNGSYVWPVRTVNDKDKDGYEDEESGGTDCDDTNPEIHPNATEIPGDGIDQDCDGEELDADGDGYISVASGGTDCNDDDPLIYPGAFDTPGDNFDQNCDGKDAEAQPPVIKSFKVIGGSKLTELDVDLEASIKGDANKYKLWEEGDGEPSGWTDSNPDKGSYILELKLKPLFAPKDSRFGTKRTIYFKAGFYGYETKKAKKVKVTLVLPKVSSFKINGNNKAKTGDAVVPVTFKASKNPINYHISSDSNFGVKTSGTIASLGAPTKKGVYNASFNLSGIVEEPKGKGFVKTVYLKVENEIGESKVVKAVVRMVEP